MWVESDSELLPGQADLVLHHVTRAEWRAQPPRGRHRPRHPFKLVLDHFTYTEPCHSYQQCMREVQDLQQKHLDEGFSDIKYHFLIGGDGNVYEGRGWGSCSSRALRTFIKLWRRRLDIAFIGDFTDKRLPEIMQERYDHIINYGVHFNLIRPCCNTLHIRNDVDIVPPGCEVIKTTRKKPPKKPKKKKKKKPKETSELSFHEDTDLDTNTTDSTDTSDREALPFTTSLSESSDSESSESSRSSDVSSKEDDFKFDPKQELDLFSRRESLISPSLEFP